MRMSENRTFEIRRSQGPGVVKRSNNLKMNSQQDFKVFIQLQ